MDYGILSILILGVTALVFWLTARKGKIIASEQRERLARSHKAKAKIIQIGKSVAQVRNGTAIVKLRIEVMPSGSDNYAVSTVWEIQQGSLSLIQPGQLVSVKIDPEDPDVIYPNVGWAEFSKLYWKAWIEEK